ncbi:MAG: metal-sulfur cluster assembly factor [Candidatus Sericytochromatia bacterium]|nr:metal-sulfur cluster assembly factor [Candidatus Sericytochromatia bacterium]
MSEHALRTLSDQAPAPAAAETVTSAAEAPKAEVAAPRQPAPAESGNKLPPLTEDDIRESLSKVVDPELHMNIIELGLVYRVDLSADPKPDIEVEMTLTSPGCPYGPMIMGQVPTVIKRDYPEEVGEINVSLTFSPPWDPATMASEDVQFELGIF